MIFRFDVSCQRSSLMKFQYHFHSLLYWEVVNFTHNFLTKRFARTSKWVVKTYGIADIGGHFEFKIFGWKFALQKKKVYQNPAKHSEGEAFWNFKKITLERERVTSFSKLRDGLKKVCFDAGQSRNPNISIKVKSFILLIKYYSSIILRLTKS